MSLFQKEKITMLACEDPTFCDHEWGEPKEVGEDLWHVTCQKCGMEQEELLIQEFWENEFITLKGKKYRALKSWGNISRCAECNKIIFETPVILWPEEDHSKAITLCWHCMKKLGLIPGVAT